MKIKRIWRIAFAAAFIGISIVVFAALYISHANDLGLTIFDFIIGEVPEMGSLRAATKVAADSFLTRHKTDLADLSDQLAVDYSKSSMIRSLGYRSEFYYWHWIIYLPYSLHTHSGKTETIVVRLSDATPGYKHDPRRFQVLDAVLLDPQGRETKQIAGQ
jgi:hypothetical protein